MRVNIVTKPQLTTKYNAPSQTAVVFSAEHEGRIIEVMVYGKAAHMVLSTYGKHNTVDLTYGIFAGCSYIAIALTSLVVKERLVYGDVGTSSKDAIS
jgi:myo-inositol-hexaphosphate 3-phosphohydrolase